MKKDKFFIGIDLGGKKKRTTGLCILTKNNGGIQFFKDYCKNCQDLKFTEILKTIEPYLRKTEVIAIDAPLTLGKGKGLMRLYEKFLSTKIFRQEKAIPLPPALLPELSLAGRELVEKLKEFGFVLDKNLIETFPTLVKKICQDKFFLKSPACQTDNQKSALICAQIAFLHSQFQTRYLGYKDGFLFLPEMSFWQPDWRKKFYQAWKERNRLKYHHLITNLFGDITYLIKVDLC
jgi:predicted nuclease with RNAse H fold